MTQTETELALVILAYAMAVVCTLVVGYLAWLKIKSQRHHDRYDQRRGEHRRGVLGW